MKKENTQNIAKKLLKSYIPSIPKNAKTNYYEKNTL